MERILLYYPTIEFPKEKWLKQALLYSDKVSSILPYRDESKFPESIKYLHWKNEYSPIYIEDVIESNLTEYKNFADKFIFNVDNNNQIFHTGSLKPREVKLNTLFSNKLSRKVIEELRNRKIAYEYSDGKIYLPENIAIYYMAGLAKFVSSVTNDNLVIPSTDYTGFSKVSFENGIKTEKAIKLIFNHCLPVPDESVELSEIIDFKNNHLQDLKRFRLYYLNTIDSLKSCRDSTDLKEALISLKENINLELSELEKLYSKNRLKTAFSSLGSLFGIENSKLFNSLLKADIISTAIDPKIGLGIGAILVTGKLIDNVVNKPNRTNEFNYLFVTNQCQN